MEQHQEWFEEEFRDIELGDQRLNRRFGLLVEPRRPPKTRHVWPLENPPRYGLVA
ncbi:MAG: hypothetical protein HY074_04095 [Deltaproteobacteria bacterium]|nr:hypothetical protein [Deltaproteobacteria bacterium]